MVMTNIAFARVRAVGENLSMSEVVEISYVRGRCRRVLVGRGVY